MAIALANAGIRKSAVLLIQLGRERAASVLSQLSEAEVEAVTAEIAHLEMISATERDSVLEEFRDLMVARAHISQGGLDFARQLLMESLGEDRADEIIDRLIIELESSANK